MKVVCAWCFWLFAAGLTLRFIIAIGRSIALGNRRAFHVKAFDAADQGSEEWVEAPRWRRRHYAAVLVVLLLAVPWSPLALGFWIGDGTSRLAQWLLRPRAATRPSSLHPSLEPADQFKAA